MNDDGKRISRLLASARDVDMTNSKPNPAYDTIGALVDLFPKCFSLFQSRRKPLKINIHSKGPA